MIRLIRDNVVKIVDSEFKAQRWERKGFKRLPEVEPKQERQQESEEIQQLRERAKELGVPRASQLGEEKLRKAIEEKEAEQREEEQKLTELKRVATELGKEAEGGN